MHAARFLQPLRRDQDVRYPGCGRTHGRRGLAAEPGPREYEAVFRENEIDETVLPNLTAEDLKELGVSVLVHRRNLRMPSLHCAAPR